MNEEEIKKIARETFIENVMNNLDSAIIFKYIQELERENARLKDKLNKINNLLNEPIFEYDNIPNGIEEEINELKNILKEN